MNVQGKIAIVTGASRGLGAALSAVLVSKGCRVYGLARHAEKLELIQKETGDNFVPVVMDISNKEQLAAWITKTFGDGHLPAILINNAGAGYFTKIDELTFDHWQEMINTNLNGTFFCTSLLVPLMKKKNDYCHIINIGSILGKTTRAEGAAYSATKYAIQGFSESLCKELRSYKIKVTCVNPGSMETHFFRDSGIQAHANMLQPHDMAILITQLIETPDNLLVDEITMRPLWAQAPPQ